MYNYLLILLVTTITGLGGLAIGGGLTVAVRSPSDRTISLLLRFTAGVILSVVCFDLLVHSTHASSAPQVAIVALIGYFCTFLLNRWTDKKAPHSHGHCHAHTEEPAHATGRDLHSLHNTGMVLAGAIAVHNIPAGMAIGATFAGNGELAVRAGILTSVIIGAHNIPEGISITTPLMAGGVRASRAVLTTTLCGIPTILGALLGYTIGTMNPALLSIAMSLASGAMLYAIFGELLRESAHMYDSKLASLATVTGILLGMVLVFTTHTH